MTSIPHKKPRSALLQPALFFFTAFLLLAAGSLFGCSDTESSDTESLGTKPVPEEPPPPERVETRADGESWKMLLITLDTTRRDHLSCYGFSETTSPNLDGLAKRGILFKQAVAPTPTTLPSHATILTGLDPQEHGVRNNSAFVLDSSHTTIAEVLAARGYTTAATLAAFPVGAHSGLSQGFCSYDDAFENIKGFGGLKMDQRKADEVTDRTLAWLEDHRDEPFFHWVHYFDPHFPYEPPREFITSFMLDYDSEIAFMDSEIGRLIDGIDRLGLSEKTWILCVGDHGESLDEHGELNHSMLIYGATQYVPCILVPPPGWSGLPEERIRGRRVEEVVRLKDLAPTMLDALGFSGNDSMGTGSSLLSLVSGAWEGPQAAYTETLVPALEYRWSDLRGVRTDRWSYIRAPEPELYDLEKDPGETVNVYGSHPEIAERLSALCDCFIEKEQDLQIEPIDPETLEKLRQLGYTTGSYPRMPSTDETDPAAKKDPKKLMHLIDKINKAKAAIVMNKEEKAEELLEEVLAEDPTNPQAARLLGKTCITLGRYMKAVEIFDRYLELNTGDREILLGKARAYAASQNLEMAQETLEALLESVPRDSIVHGFLGEILYLRGMQEKAAGHTDKIRPFIEDALAHFKKALMADPVESISAFRMGCILQEQDRSGEAIALFENALVRKPDWAEAHARLASALKTAGRIDDALEHYQTADTLGFPNPGFLLEYGITLLNSQKPEKAVEIWEKALSLNPPPPIEEKIRENMDKVIY